MPKSQPGFIFGFILGCFLAAVLYFTIVPIVGMHHTAQDIRRERIAECQPETDPLSGATIWPCVDK